MKNVSLNISAPEENLEFTYGAHTLRSCTGVFFNIFKNIIKKYKYFYPI